MVYFQPGIYGNTNITIVVDRLSKNKDRLFYHKRNGSKRYDVPIHWAYIRYISEPVQYVKIDGQNIWAVNRKR